MFDMMCVLAIPLSLKYSSFWFLNMIWCVCFSVAIASFLTKKCGAVLERLGGTSSISICIPYFNGI